MGAARPADRTTGADDASLDRNEVVVVGRLVSAPAVRELPSGDTLASFRVVVRRPDKSRPRPGSPRVDALECAAFRSDVRKVVRTWVEGDVVEITGALRRRFWRTGGAPSSIWEIEVAKARRLVRA